MSFVVREVQPTPNPNAVKLILDRSICTEPLSFRTPELAEAHPVAKRLFALKGVSAVLLLHDFVTINKSPEARWADITGRAKRALEKD
jgi:hypothetical protein